MAADASPRRIAGPTPAGGAYAVAIYLDAAGRPCGEGEATSAEVLEFSGSGECLARTYLEKPRPPAVPPEVSDYLKIRVPSA